MVSKESPDNINLPESLRLICGHAHFSVERDALTAAGFSPEACPEILVNPGSIEELKELIALAIRTGSQIIPVGGGTQIRQVLTPFTKGIGLCCSRFNHILEFEPDNLSITVEAGTVNETVQQHILGNNLHFPIIPDFSASTIGGEVAANYSSWKRFRYGTIGDHVLGLSFISPTGKLVSTGGKTVKNVSGYDFTRLLAGSWGTMGILYSITLKLAPLAEKEIYAFRNFLSITDALTEGERIMSLRPSLSSCNLWCDNTYNGDGATMSLTLEGSNEFIDSQIKLLQLAPGWNLLEEEQARTTARSDYLVARQRMKAGFFHTMIIDKRQTAAARRTLFFLKNLHSSLDYDLMAGVIEYSVPGYARQLSDEILREWDKANKGGENTTQKLIHCDNMAPLVDRLLPTIDPHGIMFRNNLFSGRINS